MFLWRSLLTPKSPPPSHGWHGAKFCVCVEQQLVHTQRQCFFFNAVCIFPPCFSFESVQGIDFRSGCFTFASKMNKLTDGGRADFSFPMFAAVLCCNTTGSTAGQHTAIGLALLWLWLRRQMSAPGERKGALFTLLIGGKHSRTANLITYANSGSDHLKLRPFLQEENGSESLRIKRAVQLIYQKKKKNGASLGCQKLPAINEANRSKAQPRLLPSFNMPKVLSHWKLPPALFLPSSSPSIIIFTIVNQSTRQKHYQNGCVCVVFVRV